MLDPVPILAPVTLPVRVSISLVAYNGQRWLHGCLASIRDQELDDYELLIIDNASTDGSVGMLREHAAIDARAQLVESAHNLGYAAGHNQNIFEARGEFVLLLNQDVELAPSFLRLAVAAFEGRPQVAAVQGRIRGLGADGQRRTTLDTTGLVMLRSRRVVSRAQGEQDGPDHSTAGHIWGVDGPAPVYRRRALIDAREPRTGGGWEVLDEDYFMYKEDVDLAWRLRLLGWGAWYAPDAVAWHARGAGSPARSLVEIARTNWSIPGWIKALSWRNHRLTQIKNEDVREYVRDLPWIFAREALSLSFIAFADPLRLRAAPRLVAALPGALRKRTHIQRRAARRRLAKGA